LPIDWRIIGLGLAVGGRHVEALFSFVEGSPGLWGFPASSCEDEELMNDDDEIPA